MVSVADLGPKINKALKVNVIHDNAHTQKVERLPSGVFQLDLAMGGGIPIGRVTIGFGPESSTKTTLGLLYLATMQKVHPDKVCVFVDVEHHFDSEWAAACGVDIDKLVLVAPTTGEQVIDIVESMILADDIGLIVVDSLAAMITQFEVENDSEKTPVGRSGLLFNKFYRKIGHALGMAELQGRRPTLYLVNQIRFKMGVMHGDPETMPGGPSFKFLSSMTIRLYGKDVIDKEINQVRPCFKEVNFVIKKYKVPIISKQGTYMLAVLPNPKFNLSVGMSYDWNTILKYLQTLGLFVKGSPSGWDLTDPYTGELTNYKVQDELKSRILNDEPFGRRIRKIIISMIEKQGASNDSVSGEEIEGQDGE